jgi:hypothetical protein
MPSRAILRRGDAPPREFALVPGAPCRPLPGIVLLASEAPGIVLSAERRRLRVRGRRLCRGERVHVRPGEWVQVGRLAVGAGDAGGAAPDRARALLLAALRGDDAPLLPALVVREGPCAGRMLPVRPGVLGRGPGSAVTVDDPTVSRRHAILQVDGDRVTVEDVGARNGLVAGAERVRGLREIRPGDELRLGRTLLALGITPPPGSPAPTPPAGRRWILLALLAIAAAVAGGWLATAP